ncbi:MAG: response regulator [Verrucomicrobiota bacterium]
MTTSPPTQPARILVIDDNRSIHDDFRKILQPRPVCPSLESLEAELFDAPGSDAPHPPATDMAPVFDAVFASQGREGVQLAAAAASGGAPFALAFVDMRMPPGWDGLQTTLELWKVSPDTQVVICTAYSDYRWDDLLARIGSSDQIVIIKKPFDPIEVLQLANALTKKWRLTHALRRRLADLEAAVQARTVDLQAANTRLREEIAGRMRTQAELAAARDHAVDADRAKSAFLANMSHEIRTPMNGVIGMASLLLETRLDDDQRDYVNTIVQSGETLVHIVNDILDFSKIEAGRLSLESIDFHLHELVETTFDLAVDLARDKKIELHREIAPDVPLLLNGDPVRIRQILLNLLGNAVKFTPAGNVRLRVVNLTPGARRATLRFDISDTGIGIAPDVLPSLFKPFTQADASTTRRFGGTGLGLAICKRITDLMHGTLTAQSRPGAGSTFSLTLELPPAGEQDLAPTPAPHPAPAAMPAPVSADGPPPDILVVEDNLVNQKVVLRQLLALGHRADLARDGREALAALARHPYRIVFMDAQMPEMDGLTATRLIRAGQQAGDSPYPANVRIIAMTAHAMAHDREACLAAGMDDYLAKPFRLQDLQPVLQRNLAALDAARDAA